MANFGVRIQRGEEAIPIEVDASSTPQISKYLPMVRSFAALDHTEREYASARNGGRIRGHHVAIIPIPPCRRIE
jgi:hypothetical protein